MAEFTIHTLGCGSAKPTPRHQTSCAVVDFRNNLFMVDCGEGAQQAFMRQHLKFNRLGNIFLTHLHGDHVFGLPGLIGTLALHFAGGSLTIHTFEEGERILSDIFNYFNRGLPFDVNFNILDPCKEEIAFENKSLLVRTIPLKHRVPCVGYVFQEKPRLRTLRREMCDFHGVPIALFNNIKAGDDFIKPDGILVPNSELTLDPPTPLSYAHIGDTAVLNKIAPKIGPVTLLYHETTYLKENLKEAEARGHSTARQAAEIALAAGAGHLLTGHYSARYDDDSLFLHEASAIFPQTILNNEGLRIDLTKLRHP